MNPFKRIRWAYWCTRAYFHSLQQVRAGDRGDHEAQVVALMKTMQCVAKAHDALHGPLGGDVKSDDPEAPKTVGDTLKSDALSPADLASFDRGPDKLSARTRKIIESLTPAERRVLRTRFGIKEKTDGN